MSISRTPGAYVNISNSFVNAANYKLSPKGLEQKVEQEAVKKEDKEVLKKAWREDVQLPNKFQQHRQAFLWMLTELESMWDGYLGRIDVCKDRVDLNNNMVRLVHSAPYRAGPTGRKFTAAVRN